MDLRSLIRLLIRRWAVVIPTIAITVFVGQEMLSSVEPEFEANGSILVLAPPETAVSGTTGTSVDDVSPSSEVVSNPFAEISAALNTSAFALAQLATNEAERERITASGLSADYDVVVLSDGPILSITARAERPTQAVATAKAVMELIAERIDEREARIGVPPERRLDLEVLSTPTKASELTIARTRAIVATVALGIVATLGAGLLAESWATSEMRVRSGRRGRGRLRRWSRRKRSPRARGARARPDQGNERSPEPVADETEAATIVLPPEPWASPHDVLGRGVQTDLVP